MLSTSSPQKHTFIFHGIAALMAGAFAYFVTKTLPYYPTAWQWLIVIAVAGLWFVNPFGGLLFSLAVFALPVAYNSTMLLAVYALSSLVLVATGVLKPYGFLVLAATTVAVAGPQWSWLLLLAPLAAGFADIRSGAALGALTCLWAEVLALLGGRSRVGLLISVPQAAPLISPKDTAVASLLDFSWTRASAHAAPGGTELLSQLFAPFLAHPTLIGQIILWGAASGAVGALLAGLPRRTSTRYIAVIGGTLLLGAGYLALYRFLLQESIRLSTWALSLLIPTALTALISPGLAILPVVLAPSRQQPVKESTAHKEIPKDTWDELEGVDDIKAEVMEALQSQFDPKVRESLRRMGIRPIRGILLFGLPGTGKTKLARVIAHEAKAAFFAISGTEFTSKWYGESEANLRRIFDEAKQNCPAVLFFDELEAFLPNRTELSHADAPKKGIVATFLGYTDGIADLDGVLLIGATNRPDQIDPAALRPGRFDKLIYVSPSGREARRQIFARYLKGKPLAPDVDLDKLAARTERSTGADIQFVCAEAALRAMQRGGGKMEPITMSDLETILSGVKPTVTLDMLREYETLASQYGRRAQKVEPEDVVTRPTFTWDDVVGLDAVKEALREAIERPLKHPGLLREYGIKPSKGVLLFGPPGCGKTFLAKVVASESGAHFLHIKGPELLQQYTGQSEARLREIFTRARENAPCVVFFDEIDALAGARGTANATSTQIITQLLTEMDGIEELKGVIVVAATNRPDTLDPALLRPGRFDRILYVPPPDRPARSALFRKELAARPIAEDVDFERLADLTEGYSAADITAICNAAAADAAREALRTGMRQVITMQRLVEQINKTPRSIPDAQIHQYELLREQWQREGERRRPGIKPFCKSWIWTDENCSVNWNAVCGRPVVPCGTSSTG